MKKSKANRGHPPVACNPWDRINNLSRPQQRAVLAALALGFAVLVEEDYGRYWAAAERSIFNGKALLYCDDVLRSRQLAGLISHGCEIEDVHDIIGKREHVRAAAGDVHKAALTLARRIVR